MEDLNLEEVKNALAEMGIPYKEGDVPENLERLIKEFGYETCLLLTDLTDVPTVEAELGVVVKNKDTAVDNGVYIFTVLHSGQAGFIVVQPGTISRAPLVRKVTGDLISAVTAVDLPPLQPFDMVEIMGHLLAGTFMKSIMLSCGVPKEQEKAFLRLYMPKFLANVGMYYAGVVKEDDSPMIYEETVNIEPIIVWQKLMKGATESENTTEPGNVAGKPKGEEKES